MRTKSLLASVAMSTLLAACGSSGHHHLPPSTLPETAQNSAVTSMSTENISNSTKRSELYNNAIASTGMSFFALSEPDDEMIDDMFDNLKDLLTADIPNFDDMSSWRIYLKIAGFDDDDISDNDDELQDWIEDHKNMIKNHANQIYDMYGRNNNNVLLNNARMSLVEEDDQQDTFIKFMVDKNNKINGIEVAENDFGAEAMTDRLTLVGDNKFQGNAADNKLYKYNYVYTGGDGNKRNLMIYVSEDEIGKKPSLDLIKEKLKLKLAERLEELSLDANPDKTVYNFYNGVKNDMLTDIDNLTDVSSMEQIINRKIEASYTSYAKNLKNVKGNLLYSDFGTVKWEEERTNNRNELEEELEATKVFAGGYDALKVKPSGTMEFVGDAVGGVNYKQITVEDENIIDSDTMSLKGGKAHLTFANGKETLNASFNNWYDVTAIKNADHSGSIEFKNGDKISDQRYKFKQEQNNDFIKETYDTRTEEGKTGAMDIGYYGKDGKPSEATGYLMYHEETTDALKGKNNLLNVVEMQVGVGMKKK